MIKFLINFQSSQIVKVGTRTIYPSFNNHFPSDYNLYICPIILFAWNYWLMLFDDIVKFIISSFFCDFYDAINTFIPWKWLKYNLWHNHTQHPKYNMKQYGNVIEYEFSVSYFSNSKWKEHGFTLSYLRCQLHSWYDNVPFVQMKHYQVHHFLFFCDFYDAINTFIPWKWLKYNHWHNHTQHPKYNMKQNGNVIEY